MDTHSSWGLSGNDGFLQYTAVTLSISQPCIVRKFHFPTAPYSYAKPFAKALSGREFCHFAQERVVKELIHKLFMHSSYVPKDYELKKMKGRQEKQMAGNLRLQHIWMGTGEIYL